MRPTDVYKRQAFVCMPGHKALYGPQGTGLLLCGRTPDTLLEGGSGSASRLPDMPQELPDRAEAGTQNVCGICGLAAGLRFVRQQGPCLLYTSSVRSQGREGLSGPVHHHRCRRRGRLDVYKRQAQSRAGILRPQPATDWCPSSFLRQKL